MLQRKHVFFSLCAMFLVLVAGCKKDFEKKNTDGTGIQDKDIKIPTLYKPLQGNIFHNYQIAQNLGADAFSGYMMSPHRFSTDYNLNYFMTDGWNTAGFNDMYTYIMGPINKISQLGGRTSLPDFWAIALIIKVEAMHRVTDKFGPIPYSKVGQSVVTTPYDSQQAVYNQFFNELDTAVNNLKSYVAANPGKVPFQSYDLVYNGDYTKWIKFANSLRLRLAIRISKVDPTTAKIQGEKALADNGGLMSAPGDDAAIAVTNGLSDLNLLSDVTQYNDNRLGATIGTYLTGFKDPRLPIYATPATDPLFAGQYIGIRIGSDIPQDKSVYAAYANINTTTTFTPLKAEQIMCAAESWFLKAEAGLRGWAGAGDPQVNYEKGIDVSMQQWGAAVGNYKSDAISKQAAYTDPRSSANNSPAISTVTIKWDASASNEQKLEKIMTQKWLAMFPEGQEAWSEFRRTGYPKLLTVVNNKSQGTINTDIQIRRLPFPQVEYNTNSAAVQAAVQSLGGADNGGTRVWWDVAGKANF